MTGVGRWRFESALSVRAAATVWAAVDVESGEHVVVKVPRRDDPDAVAAIRHEARVLSTIAHPHLVRLIAMVDDGTTVAIVLSAVAGRSLADVLASDGARPWPAIARLLAPVADALASVHAAGFVHGDVSPANVIADDRGAVLIDLGASRAVVADGPATGSPGSTAPEVAGGRSPSPASDVWSLAAVAREAAMSTPRWLDTVLDVDPARRPTATQLAARLGRTPRATREFGPRPPHGAPPATRTRRPAGQPWVLAISAAVIAAIGIAAVRPTSATAPRPIAAVECPDAGAPPPAPATAVLGDADGDGCDTWVTWTAGVLTVAVERGRPARRYAVGGQGDLVVLGDWNCDRRDTPGVYRPATGTVTLYDEWPTAGSASAPASAVAVMQPGGHAVVITTDGCDELVVQSND